MLSVSYYSHTIQIVSGYYPDSIWILSRDNLTRWTVPIPWIAANASPHSIDYSSANQAVFHHKRIQIRTGVRDNVAHDGISTAGKIVGQVNHAPWVVCETVSHQHVI